MIVSTSELVTVLIHNQSSFVIWLATNIIYMDMETLILVGSVILLLYWCRGHIGRGCSYDLGGSNR